MCSLNFNKGVGFLALMKILNCGIHRKIILWDLDGRLLLQSMHSRVQFSSPKEVAGWVEYVIGFSHYLIILARNSTQIPTYRYHKLFQILNLGLTLTMVLYLHLGPVLQEWRSNWASISFSYHHCFPTVVTPWLSFIDELIYLSVYKSLSVYNLYTWAIYSNLNMFILLHYLIQKF